MTRDEALAIRDQTALLAVHLREDIKNAQTRAEHIRLTQHAAEAERLVAALDLVLAGREDSPPEYLPTHF